MTLDLVGQGVTYKVLEPAIYPTLPVGLRYVHFAMAGPVVGLLLPIGLLVVFLFFDSHFRLPSQIEEHFPGLVLAVIEEEKFEFVDAKIFSVLILIGTIAYGSAAIAFKALA